jgi:hypothetical protein
MPVDFDVVFDFFLIDLVATLMLRPRVSHSKIELPMPGPSKVSVLLSCVTSTSGNTFPLRTFCLAEACALISLDLSCICALLAATVLNPD